MSSSRRLPRGWHAIKSKSSGDDYYFNRYTQVAQWHRPAMRSGNGHRADDRRDRSRSRSPLHKIAFSHILIKHKDCRNPMDSDFKPVTRTKDEAKKLAAEVYGNLSRDRITFGDAAVSYSECGSARYQGDVRTIFQRGRMLRAVEDAVLALDIGEVSGVVETSSGYHIIMRREFSESDE